PKPPRPFRTGKGQSLGHVLGCGGVSKVCRKTCARWPLRAPAPTLHRMPRRPRSLLPDGCFHVFDRGVAQSNLFLDQAHFAPFMEVFESTTARFDWTCHRFCLMPNHYHLVIEAMRPKLSRGMHRLTGTYPQWFDALHDRVEIGRAHV